MCFSKTAWWLETALQSDACLPVLPCRLLTGGPAWLNLPSPHGLPCASWESHTANRVGLCCEAYVRLCAVNAQQGAWHVVTSHWTGYKVSTHQELLQTSLVPSSEVIILAEAQLRYNLYFASNCRRVKWVKWLISLSCSKYLLLAILSFNPAPKCGNYTHIQQPVIMCHISSNGI